GARPLRRAIQRYIEDPLADFVLGRQLEPGSTILVGRTRTDEGEPGDEVDITFIPGEVTPEKVTVPADEPPASAVDGGEPSGEDVAKAAAVQFSCTECGYTAGRWFGKCPGCSSFGTLVEEPVETAGGGAKAAARAPLRLVEVQVEEAARISTGVAELDRVLGGGLVPA